MTLACTAGTDTFRCPSKWELWRQTLALLPRGRAWQSHEDVVERYETGFNSQVGSFESGATPLGAEPVVEDMTVLEQYWAAHAEVLEYLHTRACALIEEYFCATTVEQLPEWWIDYGFPDLCLPYADLCEKVRAQGDATCDYFVSIGARRGWDLECLACGPMPLMDSNIVMDCTRVACCDELMRGDDCAVDPIMDRNIELDCRPLAGCTPDDADCILVLPEHMHIRIHRASSPAYTNPSSRPMADAAVMDCTPFCEPGFESIVCLIERLKPAHVLATYEVI